MIEHPNNKRKSTARHLPTSEYEALMQAPPHEEPEELESMPAHVRDIIDEHIHKLEPREQWIVNGLIHQGKSLQEIGDELNFTKTHIWRLRDQAFDKLRRLMIQDTTIRKSIAVADTWEQSAMQWVAAISEPAPLMTPITLEDLDDNMATIANAMSNRSFRIMENAALFMAKRVALLLRQQEQWDAGEMVALLCRKQHDYGHGNINKFGEFGVIVRLSDKVERYKNLVGKQAMNESTNDTLTDIIGYCVVLLMLLDETFQLPLGDDYGTHTGHD